MIGHLLSLQGRDDRRRFLATWATASILLVPLGLGALSLVRAADRAGAADAQVVMLGAGLFLLAGFGHLWPVLAASVRRARDLGASLAVLGLVVGVELAGAAARAWADGDVVWMFGLYEAAVFLALALWPGRRDQDEADFAPARAAF